MKTSSMSVKQCPKREMTPHKSTFGSTAETRPVFLTQTWISGETLCLNTTHSCRSGRKRGRAVMDRVFSEPGHYRSSFSDSRDGCLDESTYTHTHTHTHSHHTAGVWCFRPMMQTHTHSGSVSVSLFLLRGSEISSANVRDSRPFKTVVEDVRSETGADSETGL